MHGLGLCGRTQPSVKTEMMYFHLPAKPTQANDSVLSLDYHFMGYIQTILRKFKPTAAGRVRCHWRCPDYILEPDGQHGCQLPF